MSNQKTIFQKVIDGEIPSEKIYEDDLTIVIKDINPQAPTHVLVIPKTNEIPKLSDATEEHKTLLGHLLLVAGKISRQLGVDEAFRLIINNGAEAGQTVFHLHLHILANKSFEEHSLGHGLSHE
ncbi:MAG: histidine triad nucleotide-binding protein [Gammaproteobacteria bacterium]|nr:histidine triad nucleotide-binding protein [Gammaproteobacteria bacterium]|tara:strand:- start:123 stop:494 length:372 start_codon:yes stop_codon:yes gene_type:complete